MKTEGRNAVLELIRSGRNIDKILMEKGGKGSLSVIFAEARKQGVRVQYAEKAALDKESESGRHQGVIAFSTDYEYYEVEDIIAAGSGEDNGGFVILCDGVEDVHNLGSILRVAECAGANGVVITKAGCAPVNESVIRISAGAAEHMKVARIANLRTAIDQLKKNGYWVYALEAGEEDIYSQDFTGNVALVIGGEDCGVRKITRSLCDKTVSLPLKGRVNSLNASVALGVAAYEVLRQRR
ncbi:MAG: 23S rRNA (guanosine(2251)-2'-O)-methyltransferase RlmB [Candidatus Borkfalkiaceae bacterium]|nr:23S rRNA (guanosine(2251)-2'-O)-methyltransferase RlmB [Clostridia bacterium]MDY6223764.1 23S rRNA (guanosine(2251)-2'-O)-methyltransferase RlmB [Christensenellaceae bacterium]